MGPQNHVKRDDAKEEMEKIHMESPDKGYRRINDELRHDHHLHVNDKRIVLICRAKENKSTINTGIGGVRNGQRIRSILQRTC